jgi:hypothetical protein
VRDRIALATLEQDWITVHQLQTRKPRQKFLEYHPRWIKIVLAIIAIGFGCVMTFLAVASLTGFIPG